MRTRSCHSRSGRLVQPAAGNNRNHDHNTPAAGALAAVPTPSPSCLSGRARRPPAPGAARGPWYTAYKSLASTLAPAHSLAAGNARGHCASGCQSWMSCKKTTGPADKRSGQHWGIAKTLVHAAVGYSECTAMLPPIPRTARSLLPLLMYTRRSSAGNGPPTPREHSLCCARSLGRAGRRSCARRRPGGRTRAPPRPRPLLLLAGRPAARSRGRWPPPPTAAAGPGPAAPRRACSPRA
jgi:hypothetical protein